MGVESILQGDPLYEGLIVVLQATPLKLHMLPHNMIDHNIPALRSIIAQITFLLLPGSV